MQSQALSLEAPAGAVEGVLTYLAPTERRPFTYNYSPPPAGQPQRFAPEHPVRARILDARPLAAELSLDRQGFRLLRHATDVDLYDDAAVERDYYPQMERLVAAATGASRVTGARRAAGRSRPPRPSRARPRTRSRAAGSRRPSHP